MRVRKRFTNYKRIVGNSTKALLGNAIMFGSFFLVFRYGLTFLFDVGPLVVVFFSGVAASLLSPKFLVHKNRLYLKYPWKKNPRVL